ncbi:hypothetical protein AGLY_000869, partial [Aphis glycines]
HKVLYWNKCTYGCKKKQILLLKYKFTQYKLIFSILYKLLTGPSRFLHVIQSTNLSSINFSFISEYKVFKIISIFSKGNWRRKQDGLFKGGYANNFDKRFECFDVFKLQYDNISTKEVSLISLFSISSRINDLSFLFLIWSVIIISFNLDKLFRSHVKGITAKFWPVTKITCFFKLTKVISVNCLPGKSLLLDSVYNSQYLQNVTIFSELEFSLIQYPSNLSVLFLNDICKLIGKKVSSNGTDHTIIHMAFVLNIHNLANSIVSPSLMTATLLMNQISLQKTIYQNYSNNAPDFDLASKQNT